MSFQKVICSFPILLICFSGAASAGELSLVSGLFKSKSSEVQNVDAGGVDSIIGYGRYAQDIGMNSLWFLEGGIDVSMREGAKGQADPDDSTSITLAAGYRHNFAKIGKVLTPYMQGRAGIVNKKVSTESSNTVGAVTTVTSTEVTETSIIYGADIGLRLSVSEQFFFFFESQVFESRLYGKVESQVSVAGVKAENEDKYFDLFASSTGSVNATKFGLGVVL